MKRSSERRNGHMIVILPEEAERYCSGYAVEAEAGLSVLHPALTAIPELLEATPIPEL